ncbi:methionyl-tRNA formyltransferase [Candidatus Saccharibacteria bacterium 32-50-10]|nr:MAG: methionyl-tRNA formyltransferase [Candidatus Saccharibacteria bacterium 32-50-10]
MTKTSPIVFFGTEDFSLFSLRALVEAGFPVSLVITKPDTKRGRGGKTTSPAVKLFAIEHGIAVLQPHKLSEITDAVQRLNRPAGVLVSYGKIIPQAIIDLFSPGIINVHPSLLPLYRGPSPIESAIANRDAKTGVTLMQLSRAMDAGPLYYQVPYALDQTETRPELYETLGQLGANILVQQLPAILNGRLQPTPQNDAEATYCQLLTKETSYLDLTSLTPGQAEARIRAHLGFPRSRVRVGSYDLIVTKAHAVMDAKTPLDLACQNGAFLSIDELVAPSGRIVTAAEFLRGHSL